MSLVSITKAQVPKYLSDSDFFRSLSADDNEEFNIPSQNLKFTSHVLTPSDLSHLLHTVQFWGFQKVQDEILEFVAKKAVTPEIFDETYSVLREFEEMFGLSKFYKDFQVTSSSNMQLDVAVACGREDLLVYFVTVRKQVHAGVVKFAAENGLMDLLKKASAELRGKEKYPFSQVSLCNVASRGHNTILEYLLTNGCRPVSQVCLAAAEHGHFECFVCAHRLGCPWDNKVTNATALRGQYRFLEYALREGCPIGAAAALHAIKSHHMDCLKLLLDHDVALTKDLCTAAARNGDMAGLTFLVERGCPMDKSCAREAASHGSLECLRFAIDHGCPTHYSVTDAAAAGGHLACLTYLLHERGQRARAGVHAAAQGGHLDCLRLLQQTAHAVDEVALTKAVRESKNQQYVHNLLQAGFSWHANLAAVAVEAGNVCCLRYLLAHTDCSLSEEDLCTAAAHDDMETLQVLHAHNCPWHPGACTEAAMFNLLGVLSFLHENGCPWTAGTTNAAVGAQDWGCLRYAVERGCPLADYVCSIAARNVSLDMLEYLHAHGAPLSTTTCQVAIAQGHMPCLQFAVANGAPLHEDLCAAAAGNQHEDGALYLRYLREELHCPWDVNTCAEAAEWSNLDSLRYAHEHGCPWDARTCTAAVALDTLSCLKYAHENGCPWDVTTTNAATKTAATSVCFEYILNQHGPCDETTCEAAAAHNHCSRLIRLHERGCPWDVRTTLSAACKGCLEVLRYAHEHGCPWDVTVSRAAQGSWRCLAYCAEHGCPIDKVVMRKYNRQKLPEPLLIYFDDSSDDWTW